MNQETGYDGAKLNHWLRKRTVAGCCEHDNECHMIYLLARPRLASKEGILLHGVGSKNTLNMR
jgi:hypothetical protein